ncbi:hypothetical protein QYE76_039197 [Lolium multiflorum]|uniref:Ternary complex factor MIP1 leucine-zipper domain-containing protein n=1 Tax=Lolium multiflorum TaxID=4521 RepID=A0AAD8WRY7_LOLMU|nr:hypothetical protein QYE76_039197 [Lolium multiflorum]
MGSPPATPTPSRGASTAGSYPVHLHRRRGLRRAARARSKMKLAYFLMDEEERRCKTDELQFEVSELEAVLEKEKRLNRVLHCSLQGRNVVCHCCLSALVPTKIRGLLAELAIIEDEIFYLEKKVDDLRLRLRSERNWTERCILQQRQKHNWLQQNCRQSGGRREIDGGGQQFPMLPYRASQEEGEADVESGSKASGGSVWTQGEEVEHVTRTSHSTGNLKPLERKICLSSPNKLSEELIKLTVTIFHKINKTTHHAAELELSSVPKLNITSCIGSSRNLAPKSSSSSSDGVKSRALPPREYGGGKRETSGGCKRFVEFTRSSFDASRVSSCLADIKNLRVLMNKLSTVDPSFLTNKQKLAFWLNIYNFCVMHAFLQHGLPPSADKLLSLLNQASVNVGGTVLNVLSIEHLFLMQSPDQGNKELSEKKMMTEGERDLQLNYGLGYPEPNVVFALCKGSRSSPPVRVYTAEEVSSELEAAKVEYLEQCVRVVPAAGARRKKTKASTTIMLPKLLYWHMRCFADDVESLLEWVHSQLPRSTSALELKRAIRDLLLHRDRPPVPEKMVEIEPYEAEFRYMLPVVW